MNDETILDALKEDAEALISDYLQDFPEWKNNENLSTYKNNMIETLFGDANKRNSWGGVVDYIEFYVGEGKVEGSMEVMIDYVVTMEQNEYVEEAVTDLDYFNSAWRFLGFELVEKEWDRMVESVEGLV